MKMNTVIGIVDILLALAMYFYYKPSGENAVKILLVIIFSGAIINSGIISFSSASNIILSLCVIAVQIIMLRCFYLEIHKKPGGCDGYGRYTEKRTGVKQKTRRAA